MMIRIGRSCGFTPTCLLSLLGFAVQSVPQGNILAPPPHVPELSAKPGRTNKTEVARGFWL